MNFLYKESESKKNVCFFLVGFGRGGGGGARVSECSTTNRNIK